MRLKKTDGLMIGSLALNGIALTSFALVGMLGCKGGGSSDSIATINGVPITRKDFDDYFMRKEKVVVQTNQGPQDATVAGGLGVQALNDMVNRQLTLNLAKEMGVLPTADQINDEITFRGKKTTNYIANLKAAGIGLDFIKRQVEIDLAQEHILTQGITVTPAEVDAYIKNNPKTFTTPPQVQTLLVLVQSTDEEKAVDKDLAAGQDFQSVAMRYSKAPGVAKNGVRVPRTNLNEFPAVVKQALESTSEGKATQWITVGQSAYAKFYVQAKAAEAPMTISDVQREELRRFLAKQKGNQAMDLQKRLLAEFKKSKIEVQSDALQPGWKEVADRLNTTQDTTTPTPSAAAPTASGAPGAPGK